MQQMLTDINKAYDCAGLRRPIVQGSIFENCDSITANIKIPSSVILAFKDHIPASLRSIYLDNNNNPKLVYFRKYKIVHGPNNSWYSNCPNITKIEAKMWFYHLAKLYVDLGYKSIHMGQMEGWAATDDASFTHTRIVLKAIRKYAKSKNTFILMTEENKKALKVNDTFLFDHDIRALRPREVSNPSVCGDWNNSNPLINYLQASPCANDLYPAIIDSFVINTRGIAGGYSPLNGCYLELMPYSTYFDFGGGTSTTAGVPSDGCNNTHSTWGWEDTKWFAFHMGSQCRLYWMGDAIKRLRNFHKGHGFMILPGLLHCKMQEQYNNASLGINPTADARYLMSDDTSMMRVLKTGWAPNNQITISNSVICTQNSNNYCDANMTKATGYNTYRFKVTNPDNTTIYTWHIQNPNGTWQPFTYGTSREFSPSVDGNYKITVRQDNLGGYTSSTYYGIKENTYTINLVKQCCATVSGAVLKMSKDESAEMKEIDNNSDYYQYIDNNKYYQATELKNTSSFPLPSLSIYPNPSNRSIRIGFSGINCDSYTIQIYNLSGTRVMNILRSQDDMKKEIDISHFSNGLYLVKIIGDDGVIQTAKFEKNNQK